MKKSIFLFFAAILCATNAWAWCGNSFITVNGTWCTGSNSYVHTGGKFDGKNLGTLTTLNLGGELQVWPSSTTAGTLCYKIDDGTENSISLPKTGTEGNNSKHSGSADVDLTSLSAGTHTIAVWFKHNSDKDDNGGKNFVATFTITAAPEPEPEPEQTVTLYFVNHPEWTNLKAHVWDNNSTPYKDWNNSESMTDTGEDKDGYDVYSYTFPSKYTNIIFKGDGQQTQDNVAAYDVAKPYFCDDKWYASLAEIPALGAVVTYDYYVIGTVNSWTLKDANFGMTDDNADGVYEKVVTLADGKNQMKINNGTWDNASTFGYDQLNANYEGVSRGKDGDDNNIIIDITPGKDITVKFDKNANKITLDGLTEKAPEPTYDYYLTGSLVGGWDVKQQGIEKDGELYKATFTELNAGIYEFKITAGDWEHQWNYNNLGAAYEEVSQGVDGEGNPNGNIKIVTEEAKNITVIFDATAGKITFEGLTPYVAPLTYTVTVPAGTEKCYIAGSMNGWAFQEMEAVTGETNKFTITIVGAKETDEYKYACQADWAYAEVIDGGGNRTNWSELDEVTAWNKPAVITYALMGVGSDWTTGIPMTYDEENNQYVLTNQSISKATDAVKVAKLSDGSPVEWYNTVDSYSCAHEMVYDGFDSENIVLEDGTYDFYFKLSNNEIYIEKDPVTIDVTLSGMVATPYSRMGSYHSLSLDDEDGNQISIFNGTEGAYGDDFEVNAYLVAYNVTVVGTGDWNVVDGVETLTATLQVEDDNTTIYNVTATVGVATTITLECYDATYTITDPELNEVTFTGIADGKEFTIVVAPEGAGYYSDGEWDGTPILGTAVEFDDSDAEEYYLGGTYIDDASNTYEVLIFGAPGVVEPTPDYTRPVTAGNYGTICLEFGSTNYTGMELYEFVGRETGKAYIASVTTLEAGVPYIFRATASELAVYSDGTTAATPGTHNGLHGTFTNDTEVAAGNYILKDNAICEALTTCYVNANRAYIVWGEIPAGAPQQMPGRKYIGMDVTGENEATGFENITNGENTTIKVIENGQLIIIRNGEKFNAQGVRL